MNLAPYQSQLNLNSSPVGLSPAFLGFYRSPPLWFYRHHQLLTMLEVIDKVIRDIWIFFGVGLAIGFVRIGIRTYMYKRPGIEEIIMAIAMAFWAVDVSFGVVTLRKGTNQMSPEARASITPEETQRRIEGSQALITAWFCYVSFIWGAKTCLLLFYKRVFAFQNQIQTVKIAGWALGATYVGNILGMFLVCRPFRHNWQVVPDPGRMWTSDLVITDQASY